MFRINHYILLLISLLCCCIVQGQDDREKTAIVNVLNEISVSHTIIFNYESNLLNGIRVFPPAKNLSLNDKIKNLEKQTNLVYSKISDTVIIITEAIKVCGYIIDASIQQPLLGATIRSKTNYSITDVKGYFEIEVASLNEIVTIRFIGFKTIERQVKFFNIERCETIFMLEQQEIISPVILNAYLVRGIDKWEDGSTSIDYSKFTLLPGLIEPDVFQTVQALPGVLSVDETVSNINIRGGSHDQNLILWDDIKMYQSGHFFGLISSFNPHITQSAMLSTSGTDVSYTDGVSGTIHMQTNKQLQSKFNGIFGLNFLNADLFLNIPLGKKSSVQVAARKSLDDFIRTPTYEVYFDRVTQDTEAQENVSEVTNSNQEFNFYDSSLRWLYNPTDKDFIRLNFIVINNELTFDETATVNESLQTRESSVSQNSIAAGLNYTRTWNDKLTTVLNIYETDYKLQAINANVLQEQRFLQENIVSETGIKAESVYDQNLWQFKTGYNFIESEITNLNDVDVPRFVRRNSEVVRAHALYGQIQYQNEKKDFFVKPGVRLNYIESFGAFILEPRLSIRKGLTKQIDVEVLGEFKHQNTSQIVNFQNDFLGIEKRRWQLTDNDSIPILKSKQASIGVLFKDKGWLADAKAYYKIIDGITTQSQSFTTKYEFEKEKGSYDAFGFEFLFRKKFTKLNSWLSYSYIKNSYTFETLEEIEFPSNFDITHSITIGSTYTTKSFSISAGLNYRTGKPTSIPVFENEVIDNDINFDSANKDRLQDYFRVDASAIYKIKTGATFRSEIGASVWNLLDTKNPINDYYRVSNRDGTANKFSRFSLGITTNVLVRIYF